MLQNLLVLLRFVHDSASLECRKKGFEVLDTIFTNIIEHPSESKYKRINMTSVIWTHYITPTFYLFRLVEWLGTLGFEQDTEHSLLCFKNDGLSDVIRARDEVRILLGACGNTCLNDNSEARKRFLPLLRAVARLSEEEDPNDGLRSKSTLATQADSLHSVWGDIKTYLRLVVLWRESVRQGHCEGVEPGTILQPQVPPSGSALWASLVGATHELSLFQLDEDLAVVDAERPGVYQNGTNSFSDDKSLQDQRARQQVVERHKNSLLSQVCNRAKVHAEVKLVGTRLIADIASCMEQIAVVEEEQGIVRKDRLEAWRLLNKFDEDGDILYLHSLKEEWAERLEAAKQKHNKPFVYL